MILGVVVFAVDEYPETSFPGRAAPVGVLLFTPVCEWPVRLYTHSVYMH
jgi:hypothetical protein